MCNFWCLMKTRLLGSARRQFTMSYLEIHIHFNSNCGYGPFDKSLLPWARTFLQIRIGCPQLRGSHLSLEHPTFPGPLYLRTASQDTSRNTRSSFLPRLAFRRLIYPRFSKNVFSQTRFTCKSRRWSLLHTIYQRHLLRPALKIPGLSYGYSNCISTDARNWSSWTLICL